MKESRAHKFLMAVDGAIPAEIGGARVSTDRILTPLRDDTVVLQAYTETGLSFFVSASGPEIENAEDLGALAVARIEAAAEAMVSRSAVPTMCKVWWQ